MAAAKWEVASHLDAPCRVLVSAELSPPSSSFELARAPCCLQNWQSARSFWRASPRDGLSNEKKEEKKNDLLIRRRGNQRVRIEHEHREGLGSGPIAFPKTTSASQAYGKWAIPAGLTCRLDGQAFAVASLRGRGGVPRISCNSALRTAGTTSRKTFGSPRISV